MTKINPSSLVPPDSGTTGRSSMSTEVEITGVVVTSKHIISSPQPIPHLTHLLWNSPREDLIGLIQQDLRLIEGIYGRCPESSSLLATEDFDSAWVRQFAPRILRAIGRLQQVRHWTMAEATVANIAIDEVVSDLLSYLGLPATQTLACTALAIVFIKDLKVEGSLIAYGPR